MPGFTESRNFYVIAGSWAGALIGWQLVVITLIANMPRVADQGQAGRPFLTPTVVHFCSVLPLAGVIAAPWHRPPVAVVWGLIGMRSHTISSRKAARTADPSYQFIAHIIAHTDHNETHPTTEVNISDGNQKSRHAGFN